MADIEERIQQVEVERAYRIVGAMEKQAYSIRDQAIPALTRLKQLWSKRVLRFDAIALGVLAALVLGVSLVVGAFGSVVTFLLSIIADPISMLAVIIAIAVFVLGIHFFIKQAVATYMRSKMVETADEPYMLAFTKNTRFFRSVFSSKPAGWNGRSRKACDEVIEHASDFVESLNDQFTNPSGKAR